MTEAAEISSAVGRVGQAVLLNSSLDYMVFLHEPGNLLMAFNPDVQTVFGPVWMHLGVKNEGQNFIRDCPQPLMVLDTG